MWYRIAEKLSFARAVGRCYGKSRTGAVARVAAACRYRLLSEIDEFLVRRKGRDDFFGTKVHSERLLADVSHRVES